MATSGLLGAEVEPGPVSPAPPAGGKETYNIRAFGAVGEQPHLGESLTNVAITGQGTIHGGGLVRSGGLLDRVSRFSDFGKTNAVRPRKDREVRQDSLRLGNKASALKSGRHVLLRDFTIFHGGILENITINNLTIMDTADYPIYCARRSCVDVQGLEIDNFKAQVADGVAVARFEEVTDLVVRNSPMLEPKAAK